jgi:hypothetical protein
MELKVKKSLDFFPCNEHHGIGKGDFFLITQTS